MRRALAFGQTKLVEPGDLPEGVAGEASGPRVADGKGEEEPLSLLKGEEVLSLEEMKTRYVHYVLRRLGNNKRRAAEVLGMGRRTLHRYLP